MKGEDFQALLESIVGQIGVPVAILRNSETGRRCPGGPARVLFALLAKDPEVVRRTLSEAARG